ncbi:MAG: egtD [Ilumatobacteraceae bacterium]|nr:egtD [Ilumatobacteraceae bacterium]
MDAATALALLLEQSMTPPTSPRPTFEHHLQRDWRNAALVDDVRRGLGRHPRRLSPRWLYDSRGSELFDEITRLPEYYPTEAERSILHERAGEIAARSGADTLIELGSGTSDKTRTLLDAFTATGQLQRFVPFDVSEQTLRDAAEELRARYPGLAVHGVVGDFTLHLAHLPTDGRPMVAFLGSTIGNLYVEERRAFLHNLAANLPVGASLLLGVDLVKSLDRLVAAYNDSQGVTARFTLNLLDVLNRELGADFDTASFDHVAFWDPVHERMDLRLRVNDGQVVDIPGADMRLELNDGEEIRVEISTKFRLPRIVDELAEAGFAVQHTWTDAAGDVALLLADVVGRSAVTGSASAAAG